MLKGKTRKLEPHSEVCMLVGYPKGTRGGLFYSPQDNKVFVSINARFLEHTYMADFKPRSKVVLEELLADKIGPTSTTVVERQKKETTNYDQTPLPPGHSRREIRLSAAIVKMVKQLLLGVGSTTLKILICIVLLNMGLTK